MRSISELNCLLYYTVESRFLEPPRKTKIGWINCEAQEIESKITGKFNQRKQKLVQEIGRFEKSRVTSVTSVSMGNKNWFEK